MIQLKIHPLILVLSVVFIGVLALEITELHVPSSAKVGDTVRLRCLYSSVKKEPLYMVKWYHNNTEFYRFTFHEFPKAEQVEGRQTGAHAMHKVNIDLSQSNQTTVVMHNVTATDSGRYLCEVISDGSLYQAVVANKDLVVRPKSK